MNEDSAAAGADSFDLPAISPDPSPGFPDDKPGLRTRLERLAHRLRLDRVTNRHIVVAAGLSVVFAGVTYQRCGIRGCPNVARLISYQPNGATELRDRNGKRFADLSPIHYRVVPLKTLPDHVPDAFLAVEDKRFYAHNGVDWRRVLGATVANLKARRASQGSSTISMQLARNLFPKQVPGQQRTLRRKLLEVRVARMIERKFSKDEILELYLNHIYFGNGAYGIEAASQQYFRKPAKELLLSQAALLAALPKAPAHYDPRRRATRAKERRNLVLALMQEQGRITAEAARGARNAPLRVQARRRRGGQDDGFAPYFVDAVRRLLEDKFGDLVYERHLRVHTTLDVLAQRAAEEELSRQLRNIEAGSYGRLNGPRYVSADASDDLGTRYVQGAAVLMDVSTGDIVAMVGGRDFLDSPFNRATQSRRQVGSAFKPFVFATAIAQGIPPNQRILDEPLTIQVSRQVAWEPRNYDGQFYGEVSMRQALVDSRNIPTVRLANHIGLGNVRETAQRAGLHGDMPEHPSMPLGTVVSSPLELAQAYTVFPGGGARPEPRYVVRVEDENGTVLWETRPHRELGAMDPRVAYIVTHMMRDVVNYGTGAAVRSVGFSGAAAGKTGTTNENSDAWFVGFTPDLVGAIWIGFDQRRTIMSNGNGGRLAAPVWGRIMRRVYASRPDPGNFAVPAGVMFRDLDPESGLVLEEGCWPRWNEPQSEVFLEGTELETICPEHGGWIGSILRGLGDVFRGGRDRLEDLKNEARRLDAREAERLEKWVDENLRRGVPRDSEELIRMAEEWVDDLRRRIERTERDQN
ncbi:MAG TPA: PBP1A family penicillin-binding protein [Longimicrobiales bacterium]|nr:PBP1A family penicillin-binding protein [Longimicrobiales bacterium]